MPAIRLTAKLWTEHVHQVRSRAAIRAAARRRRLREEKRRLVLIEGYMPAVERIARQVWRHLTHVEIEDLVQTGYVGLIEAALRYDPATGAFEAFAYFRVRGAMIDAHKRRKYRDETHESLDGMVERLGFLPAGLAVDRGPWPDAIAGECERDTLLRAAVDRLPADERRVILAALAGQPLAETAAGCGRSVAWARAKLAAARFQVSAAVAA
jgi:RNA polymerase sigma factor (sigma-70 family)